MAAAALTPRVQMMTILGYECGGLNDEKEIEKILT